MIRLEDYTPNDFITVLNVTQERILAGASSKAQAFIWSGSCPRTSRSSLVLQKMSTATQAIHKELVERYYIDSVGNANFRHAIALIRQSAIKSVVIGESEVAWRDETKHLYLDQMFKKAMRYYFGPLLSESELIALYTIGMTLKVQ